jgi:hypothetical protein
MRRKGLTDNEKLEILRLLGQKPKMSQEKVAAETHHRKAKIGETLKEFKFLSWEKTKAFCENDQSMLRLRDDYIEKVELNQKDKEDTIRAIQENLRSELGAPGFISHKKDGIWINEF